MVCTCERKLYIEYELILIHVCASIFSYNIIKGRSKCNFKLQCIFNTHVRMFVHVSSLLIEVGGFCSVTKFTACGLTPCTYIM